MADREKEKWEWEKEGEELTEGKRERMINGKREKGKKDRRRQRNYRFLSYPTVTPCCSTSLYIFNFFLIYSCLLSNLPLCLFISFSLFSCLFPLLISISFNSIFYISQAPLLQGCVLANQLGSVLFSVINFSGARWSGKEV